MKLTKSQLKQIIKEEIESVQKQNINESIRSFLKTNAIHSTIPAGSLGKVLLRNPELTQKARNAADPYGQMIAFRNIGKLLAKDLPLFSQSMTQKPITQINYNSELSNKIRSIYPDEISPNEALQILYDLKEISGDN